MSNVIKYNFVIEEEATPQQNKPETYNNKENEIEERLKELEKIKQQIISDAELQAERIIQDAKDKADEYIEGSYAKSKEIIEEARKQGFNEGYSKGYQEGKEDADKLIEEANEIKREYLERSRKVIKNIEKDVIELVIKNCEKIINMKLDDDKELILSIVEKGLESLAVSEKVTIRVSPDDYDVVELSKGRILAMATLVEDIVIKKDNNLERGGCIIETEKGSVDVSIKSQIEEMKKTLYSLIDSE
ncbi:FliH/SctL family protein [Caldisalinibacter kiritimatiensis]|uniref:Flagellar biosynthesis/type III secretory pathway protein n=1 Tax=Caldisalinibacter kiritimatiensis TaxID=1304284 RepID=R1AQA4_9FIRM|nr:FliH/SctL family protein [Caldisalinibacter kiritimatiensis]EOC99307.1 flagellar biosynthesis/type III secretory pathway protein [Caldisalinibacter kiritimatiensis]